MRGVGVGLFAAVVSAGCGGAMTIIVKPPVVSRCEETGLKGCDEITEGVLLYAEGKKDEAREKLRAGVAKNSSTRVRRYAANLKIVASLPGISDYAEPIREVCDLLADETGGPLTNDEEKSAQAEPAGKEKSKSSSKSKHSDDDSDASMNTAKDHGLRTGTVVPVAAATGYTCSPFASVESTSGSANCVRVSTGPLIVTDVHVGAGCSNDVFILAGKETKPRWFLIAPTGGMSVHGARFVVKPDEPVIVGVRTSNAEDALKKTAECSLTWAAVEP